MALVPALVTQNNFGSTGSGSGSPTLEKKGVRRFGKIITATPTIIKGRCELPFLEINDTLLPLQYKGFFSPHVSSLYSSVLN